MFLELGLYGYAFKAFLDSFEHALVFVQLLSVGLSLNVESRTGPVKQFLIFLLFLQLPHDLLALGQSFLEQAGIDLF